MLRCENADFLKDIMMPDPINTEPPQNNLGLAKTFAPFDLLDFAVDESLSYFNEQNVYNLYLSTGIWQCVHCWTGKDRHSCQVADFPTSLQAI